MVDNALIYVNLILAYSLARCFLEIYIKINSYWLAIKFIPLSPKLFSLVLFSIPVSNHCLTALWGISRKPPNFLPLARHASTPQQLSKPPVIQIGQEMSDGGSNPNRFTGYGWLTREAAEEGKLPEGCPWSKKKSFWKLAKWLWHWALSLWPSVVSLSVRSATIFPPRPEY